MKDVLGHSSSRFPAIAWFVLALGTCWINFAFKARQLGVTSLASPHFLEALVYGLGAFLAGLVCLFWKKYRSPGAYFRVSAALGTLVVLGRLHIGS